MASKLPKWLVPARPSPGQLGRWVLRRLAVIMGLTAFIMVAGGLLFRDRLIFHPSGEDFGSPANYGSAYEEIWLPLENGVKVKVWHLPPLKTPAPVGTLLFFQGNSGNMSLMAGRLAALRLRGFSVWSVDYPGYGDSSGRPSEKDVYETAEALWRLASQADGVKAGEVVIYGFSLGGGVASHLAVKHPPAALVLDSTFTRLSDVPSGHLPFLGPYFRLMLGDAFDTASRLKSLSCPLLILHSPDDDVVPYELGEALYQGYEGGPKEMVTGVGDHMGFVLNAPLYLNRLEQLLESE